MTRIPADEVQPGYFMPLVRVQATILGVEREFSALVDSGADASVMPLGLLRAFGVTPAMLTPGAMATGANGPMATQRFVMDLRFRGRLFATEVIVLANVLGPLLGRNDFLHQFGVHFHWNDSPPTWCVRKIRNPH